MNDKNLVYLSPNDDLRSALACFKNNKISHIPIFREKKFVGIVSKTDVTDHLYELISKNPSLSVLELSQTVELKTLMVQPVVYASVDDDEMQILKHLYDHNVSSVVIKDGDKVVGIVTEKDLIKYLAQNQNNELDFTEKVSHNLVQWMNEHGIFQVSKFLSDIGI